MAATTTMPRQLRGENVAYESDITTEPGYNYMALRR